MSCCATQTEAELLAAILAQDQASFDRLQQLIQAVAANAPLPPEPSPACAGPCEYGFFYNEAVSATVAINAPFPFDSEGPKSAGLLHTPSATPATSAPITIVNAGIYEVQFQATNGSGDTQLALWLDGIFIPGTRVGADTSTSVVSKVAYIIATAGSILTMRNDSGSAAFTLDPNQGGSALQSTNSLTIKQIA